jgi:RNA polymerase sigma-70 factor (ECF subfamily)
MSVSRHLERRGVFTDGALDGYTLQEGESEQERFLATSNFETLIEDHHQELYRYLWRLSLSYGSRDPASQADDLTQETYVRAYRAYEKLKPDSNVRAWLYKIATNCAHSTLGRQSRRLQVEIEAGRLDRASAFQSPEASTIDDERNRALRAALTALPFKQQAAVTLRHLEGLSYDEIGGVIDCSAESARANVYQGMQRLRQLLPEELIQ